MQVLTEFQIKITLIGEAIAEKVILQQIWTISRPCLAKILYKIAKFERISKFSDLNTRNIPSAARTIAPDPFAYMLFCFVIDFVRDRFYYRLCCCLIYEVYT